MPRHRSHRRSPRTDAPGAAQRQAQMLDVQGDRRARDLALATAASLAEATASALGRHPFLKGMVDRSLTNLVRAYAASLLDR
jgi:hypothetical protein